MRSRTFVIPGTADKKSSLCVKFRPFFFKKKQLSNPCPHYMKAKTDARAFAKPGGSQGIFLIGNICKWQPKVHTKSPADCAKTKNHLALLILERSTPETRNLHLSLLIIIPYWAQQACLLGQFCSPKKIIFKKAGTLVGAHKICMTFLPFLSTQHRMYDSLYAHQVPL